jgi:large subunit ribosomal protein L35
MIQSNLMCKRKTNKSAKKRFKITGTGKITFKRSGIKHLNSHMSARHKLRLRRPESTMDASQMDNAMGMFPYPKYAR